MKKILISILFFFVATTMFAQKQFVVDANAETRSIDKSFNEIKVSNGIDIYLSQSDKEEIAVSASEEKFKANIKTVVDNNVLNIYYDGEKNWSSRNRKMVVYISFINLQKIDASGSSDITVAGTIKSPSLTIELSGASDFKGDISVTALEIDLSGASDVKIAGVATNVNIESSGASDVKGFDLVSDNCTAKASGASDINITVNKELNAHASGASDIYYRGSAVIKDLHSSGASTVAKRGGS